MVHFEKFPHWRKLPCILPLSKNNEYITDFKKKPELFNSFFANQWSLINNKSQLSWTLSYKTNERLSKVKITDDDIIKIIAKLDPNKVHGHDKISIRMIKMCSTSICKPLSLIFNHYIDNGIYLYQWKKANVMPIHRKDYKKPWKTVAQCLYFEFTVKFLKESYKTRCLVSVLIKA